MSGYQEFCRSKWANEIDILWNDTISNKIKNDTKSKKEAKKVSKQINYNKIPYFETIIKRVKKEEKEWTPDYCPCCGQRTVEEKGNWVNGENLDKIKFPVPCSYVKDGERKFGLFSMNRGYYYIADITNQKKEQEDVSESCDDLKKFILFNNIHILKGKIIIFEEEK